MANFSVRTGVEIRPNTNAQVVVRTVRPETPAARAGIEAGDIITRVDDKEVPTIATFQKLITRQPSKPAFFLNVKRGDQSFRVPLGRQLTLLGMTLFPDPADRPMVVAVDPKSSAGYAGFQVGDMIAGFDHQLTATMSGILDFGIPFIRDMQQGQGIPFEVLRDGKKIKLSMTRPADADLPLLTPEQERHLRRLANGDDVRPRQQRARSIKTTTTKTQTTGGQMINTTNAQPNTNPYGAAGIAGFGGILDAGGVPGVGGTTGTGIGSQNVNAAVAVLRATPSTLTPNLTQQTGNAGTGTGTTRSGLGVVGFVQIQANIGLNRANGTGSNINPAAPGANPSTGNTTTNTGVNPVTGNAATSTQNPSAAATPTASQQQAQQQTGTTSNGANGFGNGITGIGGIGTGETGTNGINGTTNATNGTASGANGTNGMNGTNTGTNGNTPTQSFVSVQISRVPPGIYTLAVNQFGECGDSAGAGPGPSVLTLGTITISANGQGGLPTQTINFPPHAFIGRTVSLVAAGGGGAVGGQVSGQSQTARSAVQTAGIVACGRFTVANQGNGGGQSGEGLPGQTGTGIGTGTPTGTGTRPAPTQPSNPTGTGTTGTGTLPKVPGQLPRPMFP